MRGGIRDRVRTLGIVALGIAVGASAACTPTVRVEPPKEPIVVNLNVKIEHEVRVRVEKDVEDLFSQNPDLF
jgi:hypothetical protein